MPASSGTRRKKEYIALFKGYHRALKLTAETKSERVNAVRKAHRLASREHRRHSANLRKLDKVWKQYTEARDKARTSREIARAGALKERFVKLIKKEMKRHGEVKNALGIEEIVEDDRPTDYGDTPK